MRQKLLAFLLQFLLYYPLKQGLKLFNDLPSNAFNYVFTLLSIKTRIETWGTWI